MRHGNSGRKSIDKDNLRRSITSRLSWAAYHRHSKKKRAKIALKHKRIMEAMFFDMNLCFNRDLSLKDKLECLSHRDRLWE